MNTPKRSARAAVFTALVAVLFGIHCGDERDASFTPDSDAAFVAAIEGTYVATSSVGETTLTLCEAESGTVCAEATIGYDTGCTPACHTLRGAMRGTAESLTLESSGCGCAGVRAELAITTTLAFPGVDGADGNDGSLTSSGRLETTPSDADPYGAPVRIFVSAPDDAAFTATASGYFLDDGRLQLEVRAATRAGARTLAEKVYFTRVPGSAPCRDTQR